MVLDDLDHAELILAMSHDHLVHMAQHYPDGAGERVLLRAFEDGPRIEPDALDLDDPICEPIMIYREQFRTIRRCIDNVVEHLKNDPGRGK